MVSTGIRMRLFDTKDRHEFKPLLVELEDRPTSPLARWLFWVLVVFMVICLFWVYFAKVDIVVSAAGKVIPNGEIKIVQPLQTGVIKDIMVTQGEFVTKGQILVILDPFINDTNLKAQIQNANLLNIEIIRLNALINNQTMTEGDFNSSNRSTIQTQMAIFNATKDSNNKEKEIVREKIKQLQSQLNVNKTNINKLKQLLKSAKESKKQLLRVIEIIAKNDYEVAKNRVIEYEEEIKVKEYEKIEIRAKLAELDNQLVLIEKEYKNALLQELTSKSSELVLINSKIDSFKFQSEKEFIRSPVDGYIGKFFIHTKGAVVTTAEKLVSIIPKKAPLVFKVLVLNQDIGFVQEDMNVSVKIDTFNFQKYGLIQGKVFHVSNDAVEDEQLGLVYEVFIKPEKYFLEYSGKKHTITSGMSITAQMKIGKRRILNFFIYPLIKYMDEGMSVR